MTLYLCPVCRASFQWATMLACHQISEGHVGEAIAEVKA